MPFTMDDRLAAQAMDEFIEQARLAHAGLPDDADHLPLSLSRLRQALVQERQFPAAAHKTTHGASLPPWHARTPPDDPLHRVHRDRGRSRVAVDRPVRLDAYLPLHQPVGGGADKNG